MRTLGGIVVLVYLLVGVLIANNQSFGAVYASVVFLDLFSTLASPNLGIAASNVSGNIVDAEGGASSNYLIRFPMAALASGTGELTVQGNVTSGLMAESLNWRADYGPYSIPARLARLESDGTHSANTFGDVQDGNGLPLQIPVKANRMYHFDCELTFSSSSLGNGIGFCVEPALRLLPGGVDGAAYKAALARQSRYFNAQLR